MRDPSGIEALYHAEYDRCVRVARRITGDDGLAEQLAAEAFARAWASWRRLSRTSSPGAWVVRVTANLAIDASRRGAPAVEATAPAPAFDDLVATHLALACALRRLPRRQRDAITLRYLAGFTESEAAEALGIAVGTIKTHVHRGLATMRGLLSEQGLNHAPA